MVAAAGYDGLEIAPFTIDGQTGIPSDTQTGRIRRALAASGLEFAGFHWLLARPEGLSLLSPDADTAARSWEHLARLCDVAGELGGGNLVLGSPRQRSFEESGPGALSREAATARFVEGLAALAARAEEAAALVLVEALPAEVTNLVNSLAEARGVIAAVGHPAVDGMFDFHNACGEALPWAAALESHAARVRHVHINRCDGDAPTLDDAEFYREAFDVLHSVGYDGWVSLEIFVEAPDPRATIAGTAACLAELKEES